MQAGPKTTEGALIYVKALWSAENSRHVTVGKTPRTVLQVQALRDVETRNLYVEFPEGPPAGWKAAIMLQVQEPAYGCSLLRIDGTPGRVRARQDFPAGYMKALQFALEWPDGLVKVIAPGCYWACPAKIPIPKGLCIGVVVAASCPTPCLARVAGV